MEFISPIDSGSWLSTLWLQVRGQIDPVSTAPSRGIAGVWTNSILSNKMSHRPTPAHHTGPQLCCRSKGCHLTNETSKHVVLLAILSRPKENSPNWEVWPLLESRLVLSEHGHLLLWWHSSLKLSMVPTTFKPCICAGPSLPVLPHFLLFAALLFIF